MATKEKAQTTPGPWHFTDQERERMRFLSAADINLCESAPKLLAALEAVLREFSAYEMSPDQQRIAKQAEAAIRKARGE